MASIRDDFEVTTTRMCSCGSKERVRVKMLAAAYKKTVESGKRREELKETKITESIV